MNRLKDTGIGFVGAGRAGVTLGSYFRSKGLKIEGFISRSQESANNAAAVTSTRAFSSVGELVDECGVIFVTTPDDQIENAWNEIKRCGIDGHIVCHTSGAKASDIFAGICDKGGFAYSVHPMHAFTDRSGSFDRLDAAWFTVEGDGARLDDLKELLLSLGNRVLVIEKDKKPLYHLANVMVSNMMLALLNVGCSLAKECGISDEEAREALMPLALSNIENIARRGFIKSLTGPAERNDTGTVLRHLEVIPCVYRGIYTGLSRELLKLAEEKHPQKDYSEMIKCVRSVDL